MELNNRCILIFVCGAHWPTLFRQSTLAGLSKVWHEMYYFNSTENFNNIKYNFICTSKSDIKKLCLQFYQNYFLMSPRFVQPIFQ
jgi:hypothetical protein